MIYIIIPLIVLGLISIFVKIEDVKESKPKKPIPTPHTHKWYCYIISERIVSLKKSLKYSCKTSDGELIEMWKDDNGKTVVVINRGLHSISLYEDNECFGFYSEVKSKYNMKFSWVGNSTDVRTMHFNRCKFTDWKKKYK